MTVQLNNIVNSAQGTPEYNVNMAATMLTGLVPLIVYFLVRACSSAGWRLARSKDEWNAEKCIGEGAAEFWRGQGPSGNEPRCGEWRVPRPARPWVVQHAALLHRRAVDVSAGQIFISGKNVTWRSPRGIGMVFQSYALYPQMSVRKNLSFGLRVAGLPRDEIDKRVARASELQIEALLDRKPANLRAASASAWPSGGRCAMPCVLFDEPPPTSTLLRADLRVEIKRLHQRLKNTMIYVTHDQIEAMTLLTASRS